MTNPIAKAYKWLDEDVLLRQYSKVAKKWEDSGRDIYHLSSAIGTSSVCLGIVAVASLGIKLGLSPNSLMSAYSPSLMSASIDFNHNIAGLGGEIEEISDSNSKSIDPFLEIFKKNNRISRVPFFLSGVGLVGKVGYDVYNYFANGESIPGEDFNLVSLGLSNIGIASSMYLKDRDPKLLDKQPAWRRAFQSSREKAGELSDRVKEGVQDWIPRPGLVPVRCETQYNNLEDYVK